MLNGMSAKEAKIGLPVMCNGYRGKIIKICEWSRDNINGHESVMVEVRLQSGVVCVECHDLVPILEE